MDKVKLPTPPFCFCLPPSHSSYPHHHTLAFLHPTSSPCLKDLSSGSRLTLDLVFGFDPICIPTPGFKPDRLSRIPSEHFSACTRRFDSSSLLFLNARVASRVAQSNCSCPRSRPLFLCPRHPLHSHPYRKHVLPILLAASLSRPVRSSSSASKRPPSQSS